MSETNSNNVDREFLDHLWDLYEGQLSEQAAARLNELLLADRGRRAMLVQFMQLVAGLEWEHSGVGGKAPEAVARARFATDMAVLCSINSAPPVADLGNPTAFMVSAAKAGVPSRNSSPATLPWRRLRRLADWLQPRQSVAISRAAAAILLVGTLTFGVLLAATVTMAVMRSQAQAAHVPSPSHFLGSRCVGRTERDMATGTVCFVRDPTTVSGRAASFSFYNVHADNDRWITPIILARDPAAGTYRVTGIGQPVLNLGSGVQTVPFQVVAGSGDLQAGVHTFGFYHGTVDKTGKATSASLGPLDFDPLPQSDGSVTSHDGEARWLFVPWDSTPVQLRLDLEFNLEPRPIQVTISPDKVSPRERIYSGHLEIIVQPQLPTLRAATPSARL